MNAYFYELGKLWVSEAGARGAHISAPELDPAVSAELLELARVVAHSEERRFAPLAAFTAGVACERFRNSGGGAAAEYVRAVREVLETQASAPGGC